MINFWFCYKESRDKTQFYVSKDQDNQLSHHRTLSVISLILLHVFERICNVTLFGNGSSVRHRLIYYKTCQYFFYSFISKNTLGREKTSGASVGRRPWQVNTVTGTSCWTADIIYGGLQLFPGDTPARFTLLTALYTTMLYYKLCGSSVVLTNSRLTNYWWVKILESNN